MSKNRVSSRQQSLLHRFFIQKMWKQLTQFKGQDTITTEILPLADFMTGVLPQQTDAYCWQGHVLSHFCFDPRLPEGDTHLCHTPSYSVTVFSLINISVCYSEAFCQNLCAPRMSLCTSKWAFFWEAGLLDQIKQHENGYPISVFLNRFLSRCCTESHRYN